MVFPVESEDRFMRNQLMLCQDHARMVVEVFRKILIMIDDIIKGDFDELDQRLEEVEKLYYDSREVRRTMMKELHSTGVMIVDQEGLYRLIGKSGEVMDHIEGIGFRLWEMGERRWIIPRKVGEGLTEMADAALETLVRLRESLMSLSFNSDKAVFLTHGVDEGERRVDALYRTLDLEIITSESGLPVILIMRDIAEKIEDMIDRAEEEADIIRILAA